MLKEGLGQFIHQTLRSEVRFGHRCVNWMRSEPLSLKLDTLDRSHVVVDVHLGSSLDAYISLLQGNHLAQ